MSSSTRSRIPRTGSSRQNTARSLAQRRNTTYNGRLVNQTRTNTMRRMNTAKRGLATSSRNVSPIVPQGPTFTPIRLPDGTEVYQDEEELFEDIPSQPKKLHVSKLREQPEKAVDVTSESVDQLIVKASLADAKFKLPPSGTMVEPSTYRGVLSEVPEQKYQSLRNEIVTFRNDLEQLKKESNRQEDKEFADDLSHALEFASQHLEETHEHKSFKQYFGRHGGGKYAWVDPPLASCVDRIRHSANTEEKAPGDSDRVKYQLFRRKNRGAPGTFDKQFADCEKRMTRIELFIGFIHNMEFPYPDLIHAFTFLESRFERIVAGQRFNVPSPQVRLVKEELRRIGHLIIQAEQRKPIKPEFQQRRQEWYKIDDLFSIMSEHDELVFRFVHVISRLQCLRRIHERTYDAIERTNKLYAQQEAIIESVQADNAVLKTLLQTMEENSTQLRKNFNHLEHRQTVLEKTVDRI